MNHTQPLLNNTHDMHSYQPSCSPPSIPLKFKAMILKSIYDKHRGKQLMCKRNAFHLWYIQKNKNELIKDHIDRLLIAQNQSKFTASRFFYRVKFFVRKELASINNKSYEQTSQQSHPQSQAKQKQKSSNSQIKQPQYCPQKNFSNYFQSLKHIFSMKIIDCQKQLLSGSLINDKDQKANSKHQRFKTEGCEVGTSVDESFQAMCRLSVYREGKIVELERKQTEIKRKFTEIQARQVQIDRKLADKVNSVKQLGKKVGFTLVKSFLINKEKQLLLHGFNQFSKHCKQLKNTQEIELNKLRTLQLTTKQSSQIQIQTQTNTFSTCSQSFLQTQRSSQSSIPPLNHITNQISHVQYSISLLSQTIKKDNDLQELYKQFQAQFGEFQAIEKDFQLLRVKTRNSLFDRLINIKKKLQKYLIKQAFALIKHSTQCKTSRKSYKNISRSRVNLQTLHQVFSKRLIPISNTQNQKQDYRSQVQRSMTSIKMICERNNNTDSKFYKPPSKGAIKKQTWRFDASSVNNETGSEMNTTQGENCFKEKPTGVTESPGNSNPNSPSKSHVNFVLPHSGLSSKWSIKPKKSQVSLQSMNDGFRKKQQHKMNSTGFYELSMRSFDDSDASSSPSTKYHAQMKTQYWWNDLREKENLALRDGQRGSRQASRESEGNDDEEV